MSQPRIYVSNVQHKAMAVHVQNGNDDLQVFWSEHAIFTSPRANAANANAYARHLGRITGLPVYEIEERIVF